MPKKVEVVEMPEALSASEACENINKVPKRQWRRWNQQARFIFNDVFSQMAHQKIVTHPKLADMSDEQWKTIRWNAAWIAADATLYTTKEADTAVQVMPLFSECLKNLYTIAGLDVPKSFDPTKEARRVTRALRTKSL